MAKNPFKSKGTLETTQSTDIQGKNVQQVNLAQSKMETQVPISAATPGLGKMLDINKNMRINELQQEAQDEVLYEAKIPALIAKQELLHGRDLKTLASNNEALTAAIVRETGGMADPDDPRIKEAVASFGRLAMIQEQQGAAGLTAHVKTLAMSEMKRMQNEHPLFKDEIRAAAAKTLGFDPSGADLAEAFGVFSSTAAAEKAAKAKESKYEKDVKDTMARLKINREKAESYLRNQELRNTEKQLYEARVRAQEANGDDLLNLNKIYVNEAASNVYGIVLNEAGNKDFNPETFINTVVNPMFQVLEQRWNNSTVVTREGGGVDSIIDDDDARKGTQDITDIKNRLVEMVRDGSLKKITEYQNELTTELAVKDVNAIPGIAQMHALVGKENLAEFMNIVAGLVDSPNKAEFLKIVDPKHKGMMGAAKFFGLQFDAFSAHASDKPAETTVEKNMQVVSQQQIGSAKGTTDEFKAQAARNTARDQGAIISLKAFDNDATVTSVLNNPKQRDTLVNMWTAEAARAQQNVQDVLSTITRPGHNVIIGADGRFKAVVPNETERGFVVGHTPGMSVMTVTDTGELRDAVKRLNVISDLAKRYGGTTGVFDLGGDHATWQQGVMDFISGADQAEEKAPQTAPKAPEATQDGASAEPQEEKQNLLGTVEGAVESIKTQVQKVFPGFKSATDVNKIKFFTEEEKNQFINDQTDALLAEEEAITKTSYRLKRADGSIEDNLTGGLGHKMTPEEAKLYPEGTEIPMPVIVQWYKEDRQKATRAAIRQASDLGIADSKFLPHLTAVNFQLGSGWPQKFPKAYQLMQEGKYREAATEFGKGSSGGKSLWAKQTPKRVSNWQMALNELAGF